jgi:hypothetical protein
MCDLAEVERQHGPWQEIDDLRRRVQQVRRQLLLQLSGIAEPPIVH